MQEKVPLECEFTAETARRIRETMGRWRDARCVTLMEATLADIRQAAVSGKSQLRIESVGDLVDIEAFMRELQQLGFLAVGIGDAGKRSLEISW